MLNSVLLSCSSCLVKTAFIFFDIIYDLCHLRLCFFGCKCLQLVQYSFAAKMRMEMLGLFKSSTIHIDISRGKHALSFIYADHVRFTRKYPENADLDPD